MSNGEAFAKTNCITKNKRSYFIRVVCFSVNIITKALPRAFIYMRRS